MSLFARSYNRFAGNTNSNTNTNTNSTSSSSNTQNMVPVNDQNITYRKKLSAVSTSLQGDDVLVAASPRNCYSRNAAAFPSSLRRHGVIDETDGGGMSTERTPVELRAAEIRRMNSCKKDEKIRIETHHTPPPPPPPPPIDAASPQSTSTSTAVVANPKKSRTSTSSLASVFRSRASSPIERMRKFIGRSRSSSKQPKELTVRETPLPPLSPSPIRNDKKSDKRSDKEQDKKKEKSLIAELEKTKIQLSEVRYQLEKYQEKERIPMANRSAQTREIEHLDMATMTMTVAATDSEAQNHIQKTSSSADKENIAPPDVISCLDTDRQQRIRHLETEVAALRKECADKTEDFRRTRKDFILILREAVVRKDEAERKLDGHVRNVTDDDDWTTLMSQHRHTLRRNVLLMWVQKKLEPYSIFVSNFSSDWTDCRAFCALISDLFPHLLPADSPSSSPSSPTPPSSSSSSDNTVSRCRRAFHQLDIPFDERALGLSASPSATDSGADDDSSCASSIHGLTDWRFVMNTVFLIYKRGVLGK